MKIDKIKSKLVKIGHVLRPHGIKGAVKVVFFMDKEDINVKSLISFAPISIPLSKISVIIPEYVQQIDSFTRIVSFVNYDSRTKALEIQSKFLYVDRANFPETSKGSVYLHDLVGNMVFTSSLIDNQIVTSPEAIGTVKNIVDYGSLPLINIIDISNNEFLVPYHSETVFLSDNNTIVIDFDLAKEYLELSLNKQKKQE